MYDFFFILFSIVTVLSALLVTVSRNAVNAAMFMIVSFVGVAAMFLLLDAFFLAILQVLVYAGAIMVLFLFIVMLLDVEAASKKRFNWVALAASVVGLLLMVAGGVYLLYYSGETAAVLAQTSLQEVSPLPEQASANWIPFTTSARSFGYSLFTKYMLPFQVTGFLLLIAMIGVIVVSKKIDATGEDVSESRES